MKVLVTLTTEDVRRLIIAELSEKVNGSFSPDSVIIEVKSKQNYKNHEWETGEIRATLEVMQ